MQENIVITDGSFSIFLLSEVHHILMLEFGFLIDSIVPFAFICFLLQIVSSLLVSNRIIFTRFPVVILDCSTCSVVASFLTFDWY